MVEVKSFKEYLELPQIIWGIRQPTTSNPKYEAIQSGIKCDLKMLTLMLF